LEIGDNRDCCCLQALSIGEDGHLSTGAFKHNSFLRSPKYPHVSGLYRAVRWTGELTAEEEPFAVLSPLIHARPEFGQEIWNYIHNLDCNNNERIYRPTWQELKDGLGLGQEGYMDHDELETLVPSETVRRYILETGWTFTDMERAALLHHSDLPLEQKDSCLRDLQTRTEDEGLRKQLSEYLSQEVPFNEERDGYFTYIFYKVPNPFERGDIVRLVDTEDYGIVETSQKQWQDNLGSV